MLVTFNPAWAGRGLRGWLKKQVACQACCETVFVCEAAPACAPSLPTCCPPAACGCCSPETLPMNGCEGDSTVLESSGTVIPPVAVPQPSELPAESDTLTPDPGVLPQTQGLDVSPSDAAPAAAAPSVDSAEGPATQEVPLDTPDVEVPQAVEAAPIAVEPEAATEPELPATEAELPATEPELPATEAELPAADDVLGEETQPATDDELFGEPNANEPHSTESSDLFGEADEPSTSDSNEDLFGDSSDSVPTESDSAQTAGDADDLFGSSDAPSAVDQAIADPNPVEPNASQAQDVAEEDLFGQQPPPAVTEGTEDDLFGEPKVTETVTDESTRSTETPVQESTESEESPSIPSVDAEDDLFGTPSSEQGTSDEEESVDLFGLDEQRTWRDNTGTFQVDARLVELSPESVRLLKSNGKYCHVPIRRLSVEDRALVELVAGALPPGGSKFVSIPSGTN